MNPWHDVSLGDDAPNIVNAIIEITNGSNVKYELDKESGMIIFDRMLYSSVHYPANYGFLPKTHCDDNDPLDVLVISQANFVPMCLVPCRIIGVLQMVDGGVQDDKLIAVPADDAQYEHVESLEDLPKNLVDQIRNFFETYKMLEKKSVEITGVLGKKAAMDILEKSIQDYKVKFS